MPSSLHVAYLHNLYNNIIIIITITSNVTCCHQSLRGDRRPQGAGAGGLRGHRGRLAAAAYTIVYSITIGCFLLHNIALHSTILCYLL